MKHQRNQVKKNLSDHVQLQTEVVVGKRVQLMLIGTCKMANYYHLILLNNVLNSVKKSCKDWKKSSKKNMKKIEAKETQELCGTLINGY